MVSECGQASVEWAGVVLLVALAFGALVAVVPRPDGPLGEAVAARLTGTRPAPAAPHRAAAPLAPARGRRMRELLRKAARRGVAANGLACFLRRSTETGDADRIGDDIADAINCLNPVDGWTGDVRPGNRGG